jgi:hypothetical protein
MVRLSPVLARITGEKLFCGLVHRAKSPQKSEINQVLTMLDHGIS